MNQVVHPSVIDKIGKYAPPELPDELKWPHEDIKRTAEADIEEVELTPTEGKSSYLENEKITFRFPKSYIADLTTGYLNFSTSCTKTGGTFVNHHTLINSIFERVKITEATIPKLDVNKYNLQCVVLWENYNDANAIAPLFGVDTLANRKTAASAGKEYFMPFFLDVLSKKATLFHKVNGEVDIEFTIAANNSHLETDGASPIMTLTNPKLKFKAIKLSKFEMDLIKNSEQVLTFDHVDISTHVQTVSSVDHQISPKGTSLKSMIIVERTQSTLNTATTVDKLNTWNFNNSKNFQFIHGTHRHPIIPRVVGTTAVSVFKDFLDANLKWNSFNGCVNAMGTSSITLSTIISGKYVRHVNFEKFQHAELIGGKNLIEGSEPMLFHNEYTGAPGSAQQIDILMLHTGVWIFRAGGKWEVTL